MSKAQRSVHSMVVTQTNFAGKHAIQGCHERSHPLLSMHSLVVNYGVMPPARTIHPDARRFGEIIKDLRLQRGWNLQQFASASKMTANYLGLLERGLNLPSITCVINLAFVLGVDPAELVRHIAAGRKRAPVAVLPPLPPDEA